MDRILVGVRIRPLAQGQEQDASVAFTRADGNRVMQRVRGHIRRASFNAQAASTRFGLSLQTSPEEIKIYAADAVFDGQHNNLQIFNQVARPMVDKVCRNTLSTQTTQGAKGCLLMGVYACMTKACVFPMQVLKGFNVTVFAYGQTGEYSDCTTCHSSTTLVNTSARVPCRFWKDTLHDRHSRGPRHNTTAGCCTLSSSQIGNQQGVLLHSVRLGGIQRGAQSPGSLLVALALRTCPLPRPHYSTLHTQRA